MSDFIATYKLLSLQYFNSYRTTSSPVMIFFSPKCTSSVCDGIKVTGLKRSSEYSLHLPRTSFSLLVKTLFGFWWIYQYEIFCEENPGWFAGTLRCLASNWNLIHVRYSPKIASWIFPLWELQTLLHQKTAHANKIRFWFEAMDCRVLSLYEQRK